MLKSWAARIVFAPKDYLDAREISDELGFTTVKVKTYSAPLFNFSGTKARRSKTQNISEQRRASSPEWPRLVRALAIVDQCLTCKARLAYHVGK
jgi:hypothetical protein